MSLSKKSALISTVTALLCLIIVGLPHAALAYDAAADYSTSSNPNGVWSYGWSTTLGSTFNLDTSNTVSAYGIMGFRGWLSDQSVEGVPYSLQNNSANPITIANNTTYQPGQLALNPGLTGQYAIIRWTAPSTGQFNIAATFSALSSVNFLVSSDVHILRNGGSIFDSNVIGSPSSVSYSGLQSLAAGDRIDFAVGFGDNGNDFEDTTGLTATIVAVPEPMTVWLVGTGLVCLFSFRFLNRK